MGCVYWLTRYAAELTRNGAHVGKSLRLISGLRFVQCQREAADREARCALPIH